MRRSALPDRAGVFRTRKGHEEDAVSHVGRAHSSHRSLANLRRAMFPHGRRAAELRSLANQLTNSPLTSHTSRPSTPPVCTRMHSHAISRAAPAVHCPPPRASLRPSARSVDIRSHVPTHDARWRDSRAPNPRTRNPGRADSDRTTRFERYPATPRHVPGITRPTRRPCTKSSPAPDE
jgi:hypothetical protein